MGAKAKAQNENLRLFAEDDQQTIQSKQAALEGTAGSADISRNSARAAALAATPKEVLLGASDPEARQLFELAIEVKKLKPWRWVEETDLIGIENPATGEIGFISVMGALGEYEAVALYLGAEGFYGFIDLQEQDSRSDQVIALNHLQVAFSDRKYLEKEDLDLIKRLGLKFKGAGAWPMFRSYRNGYLPWFITRDEAQFLVHALSQIIDVATKVRDKAQPFHPTGRVEKGGYLMRVSRKTDAGLVWEDQVWRIPKPHSEPIRAVVDASLLESLKQISRSTLEFEIDLNLLPAGIGEAVQRPVAAYMLMAADNDSGYIFGFELLSAQDSLAAMYSRLPNAVANILSEARIVPTRMAVRSGKLHGLLKPLAQILNIELRYTDELPSIDEASESMTAWMRSRRL